MPALFVPIPEVKFEATPTGLALLEKPVEVRCGAVTFPGGNAFGLSSLGTGSAGYFIYRRQGLGAATQVWDEEAKEWRPDPGVTPITLKQRAFAFKPSEALPWQSLMVAAGQKDKDGEDQFERTTLGFPEYFVRAYFASDDSTTAISGLSAPSQALRFASMIESIRAGLAVVPDGKPAEATEVVVYLKDGLGLVIGAVVIKNVGGLAEIEVSNRVAGGGHATIRLRSDGDIEIEPASGKMLVIRGDIEVGQIHYQPSGAPTGSKKWLP